MINYLQYNNFYIITTNNNKYYNVIITEGQEMKWL